MVNHPMEDTTMSLKLNTQHVNGGDVADRQANYAVGGAMAWLAFYAMAAVIGVMSNFHKAADIVVAAAN